MRPFLYHQNAPNAIEFVLTVRAGRGFRAVRVGSCNSCCQLQLRNRGRGGRVGHSRGDPSIRRPG
jgi:hypothetical protein